MIPINSNRHDDILKITLPTDIAKIRPKIAEAFTYLREMEKPMINNDEAVFVALLEHQIDLLGRVKTMIARERFTVEFAGDKDAELISLKDFRVVPIVNK